MKPMRYTRIALQSPATGGKHYRRGEGELVKETVGWISRGRAFVDEVADMTDFATVLNSELRAGVDVLTFGVPKGPAPEQGVPLVAKDKLAPGAIARSRDHFEWPDGPAIFAADYDPRDGHEALTRDELWGQVTAAAPGYADHDVLWGCSSSSYVYQGEEQVVGLKGQRLYMGVLDGTDIERAGTVMLKRFWLEGLGHIMISESGAQLVRATLDPCMYQPERIDYAAGAVCGAGLEQRRPDAFLISEGLPLADTRAVFPDLTAAEESAYETLVAHAKADTREAADAQREVWVDARLEEEARTALGEGVNRKAVTAHVARSIRSGRRNQLLRAVDAERVILAAPYVLHLSNGQTATVGEVLRKSQDFDGVTTADPLEPDYRGGATTGKLYPYNRRLVSQAHGVSKIYILGTDDEYRAIHSEIRNPKMMRPTRLEDTRAQRIARMMETRLK